LKRGHSNTIPAKISFNDFREEICENTQNMYMNKGCQIGPYKHPRIPQKTIIKHHKCNFLSKNVIL